MIFLDVRNKVVIVTGASSGIGLATVKLLAKKGAKLALVSRSREKLERIAKRISNSLVVPNDMSNISEVKSMIEKVHRHFGKIDVLINCAGQGYDAPVEETNIETLCYIFDLDVVGPLVAMQQVIPIMKEHGGGTVINISSGTALMNLPGMSPYSSSKRALAAISLAARQELEKDNIVVSVVYPYITLTEFERAGHAWGAPRAGIPCSGACCAGARHRPGRRFLPGETPATIAQQKSQLTPRKTRLRYLP